MQTAALLIQSSINLSTLSLFATVE